MLTPSQTEWNPELRTPHCDRLHSAAKCQGYRSVLRQRHSLPPLRHLGWCRLRFRSVGPSNTVSMRGAIAWVTVGENWSAATFAPTSAITMESSPHSVSTKPRRSRQSRRESQQLTELRQIQSFFTPHQGTYSLVLSVPIIIVAPSELIIARLLPLFSVVEYSFRSSV